MMHAMLVAATLALPPLAHPMGNFSINQYHEFVLQPDRIEVLVVVDTAEIPTLQARSSVDTDGDGSATDGERETYAGRTCAEVAAGLTVQVGNERLMWSVPGATFAYAAGAGGLQTSRLECSLVGTVDMNRELTLTVENRYLADQVGWREMTATADGVRLSASSIPAQSVTDRLRTYREDLLSSVLDVRSAELTVEPGDGVAAAAPVTPARADPVTRLVAAADAKLQALVGGHLTLPVALLAILLATLLGAAHAALPGHGKTVMAAYLAGTRGRVRDAVAVGGAVTASHTIGVLVVGGLLAAGSAVIGDGLMRALSLVSAVIVVTVGIAMLVGALRRKPYGHRHHGHHHHDHGHHHHGHEHGHDDHAHGHAHHHDHDDAEVHTGRWGLAGIGLAGGLVPSPSALIVLLAAVGLGHALFGVLLVLIYGLGMAGTLTGAGLLLVVAQRRLRNLRWSDRISRLVGRGSAALPTVTAAMIVIVGCGLALRAVAGAL